MPNPLWDYDPLTIGTTRSLIRGALEEATGQRLSLQDPSPDSLIASAQELDIPPAILHAWIHSHTPASPAETWTAAALTAWNRARRSPPSCERCGASIEDEDSHRCE